MNKLACVEIPVARVLSGYKLKTLVNELPDDAILLKIYDDFNSMTQRLIFFSEEFPEVADNAQIPKVSDVWQRNTTGGLNYILNGEGSIYPRHPTYKIPMIVDSNLKHNECFFIDKSSYQNWKTKQHDCSSNLSLDTVSKIYNKYIQDSLIYGTTDIKINLIENQVKKPEDKKIEVRCECGSEKIGSKVHSEYCPKKEKE